MIKYLTHLKGFHNTLGMLVLAILLLTTIFLLINLFLKKPSNKALKIFGLVGLVSMHLQVLLGLIIYFISPLGITNFSAEMMGHKTGRFYILEHPVGMLLAVLMISLGYRKIKQVVEKRDNTIKKHFGIFIYYALAFAISMALVPWFLWAEY